MNDEHSAEVNQSQVDASRVNASEVNVSQVNASEVIEFERAQIANEIHDSLLPLIVGAKAAVESHLDDVTRSGASSDDDHSRLRQAFVWLQQASHCGRELLTLTYPPELESLEWFVAAKHVTSSIVDEGTSLTWQIDPACGDYERPIALAAYRIVVEAVRNAVRHAKATEITVVASSDQVTITDNGCGFDPEAVVVGHFGLRSMKARARSTGGQLTIDSRPGQPTTVAFKLLA